MAIRLNPYISFTDNAQQAMEFYQSVFGGNLTISRFGEFGAGTPGESDKVMHAMLQTDGGLTLMASDTPEGMEHRPGNNISISLSGDSGEELHAHWKRLSEGGTGTMPMAKQPWGDEFGMCVDRFGVHWMVDIVSPQ